MASDIEWTDETWNPTTGCTPVSAGCLNCYAATFAHRGLTEAHRGLTVLRDGRAVFNGKIKLHEDRLAIPLKWRKPRRVFVDSMSDLFHEGVPFDFVDRVFAVMALCPQHTFQVLTKRPERMAEYVTSRGRAKRIWSAVGIIDPSVIKIEGKNVEWSFGIPANAWLGTSIENQDTADERIPHLLRCPAAVRFLSYEPALGPVVLRFYPSINQIQREQMLGYSAASRVADGMKIGWVIVGGESGRGARPANIEWFRAVRDQCKAAGVAFFMKQMGADCYYDPLPGGVVAAGFGMKSRRDPKGGDQSEWPEDLRVREFPAVAR